jgi:hypothetical protein
MDLLLFLGGTCNNSSWRQDLIPLLEYENIPYFNPVVENWDDEAIEREIFVKSLPNTVELYVLTKEMKGYFSIAEAVEASNKKPEKTIFMFLKEGFDKSQIKSLEEIKKLISENGAYVADSLVEVALIFKGIQLNENSKVINNRISSRRNQIRAKEKLSYERIFDISGVSDYLESIYIKLTDLNKDYLDIFYNSIKRFLNQPLYKSLDINNPKDLKFLKETKEFNNFIENIFDKIYFKLNSRKSRLEKFFSNYESKSIIDLEDIISKNKIDRVSLLFILSELKKEKKIYDFNGRFVNLN